jgi:propanol-preferring alcohol dehydrogenase
MGVMTNSWTWLPAPTAVGQVGGHEGVGTIAKFGPGSEGSGLKLGDRVGYVILLPYPQLKTSANKLPQ